MPYDADAKSGDRVPVSVVGQVQVQRVWVIDPCKINLTTCGDADIRVPGGPVSSYWLHPTCRPGRSESFKNEAGDAVTNSAPIAVFPIRADARVIAQHSAFTVHGSDSVSIDALLGVEVFTPTMTSHSVKKAMRIDINPSAKRTLLDSLRNLKVNDWALFPQLDKLCAHIKTLYGID